MNHYGLGSAGPVPRLLLDEGGGMARVVARDGLADLPPDDAVMGVVRAETERVLHLCLLIIA